jgi:terpene synthase-like protein
MPEVTPEFAVHYRELFRQLESSDQQHELGVTELTEWMAAALSDAAIFPAAEVRQKRLAQLVVFTYLAAPKNAPAVGLRWAAEFLFVFFLFNDHWQTSGALLLATPPAASNPRLDFVRAWRNRVKSAFGAESKRFLDAFELYLQSLLVEQTYDRFPEQLTLARYIDQRTGRYQWVATSPYIDLWELTSALKLAETERSWCEPLKELAVELTYLANDVGSLGRDRGHKNYVLLSSAAPDDPTRLKESLDDALRLYADKVQSFRTFASQLPDREPLHAYATLVARIADGNLRATSLLASQGAAGRYSPWVRGALESLPLISG